MFQSNLHCAGYRADDKNLRNSSHSSYGRMILEYVELDYSCKPTKLLTPRLPSWYNQVVNATSTNYVLLRFDERSGAVSHLHPQTVQGSPLR